MTGNNMQIPHFSMIFAKVTKIQCYMHVCLMHTWQDFGYPCDGDTRMWSLLFPVMNSTEDAIASLCYPEKCINVLVTA
jgi:hypothetical protein